MKGSESLFKRQEILHELLINVFRFSDVCYFLRYYVQSAEIVQLAQAIPQLFQEF